MTDCPFVVSLNSLANSIQYIRVTAKRPVTADVQLPH